MGDGLLMKFLHTADWQIGKPFANIEDTDKRSIVRQARLQVLDKMGEIARQEGAAFVVVAGDLFDSPSADKATVAAACGAIGKMGVPVYVIPGNHDHGGPASVWEQEFFRRESARLAPNLTVLLEPAPVELEDAVLLPCPLLRRQESRDLTEWLRVPETLSALPPGKARIVLAHGSTQDFTSLAEDEEGSGAASNRIELNRLPADAIDYIALGDWHGTKEAGAKAWYAGTPEHDRFPKGGDHQQGHVLVVEAERGQMPVVNRVPTGRLTWSEMTFDFADDADVEHLEGRIDELLEQRTNEDLLRLHLSGSLGIEASHRLESLLESLEARLLRLKVEDGTRIAPTEAELESLVEQKRDPLIAGVARLLVERTRSAGGEEAITAALALRELHAAYQQEVRQ